MSSKLPGIQLYRSSKLVSASFSLNIKLLETYKDFAEALKILPKVFKAAILGPN
jgi:hypothetical protein